MENKKSFEERMNHLNELVNKLQDSSLPLDEALNLYNECITLSNELKSEIDNAINKVTIIKENQEEDF